MRTLRIVLVLLVALLAWLQYRLWFGNGGNHEVAALQDQVEQQARQNDGLRDRNAALAAEVADLKSGEAVFDLKSNGVELATTGGKIDDLKAELDKVKADIVSGKIVVPTKP